MPTKYSLNIYQDNDQQQIIYKKNKNKNKSYLIERLKRKRERENKNKIVIITNNTGIFNHYYFYITLYRKRIIITLFVKKVSQVTGSNC